MKEPGPPEISCGTTASLGCVNTTGWIKIPYIEQVVSSRNVV